jgi:hypothetical protein
MLAKIFPSYHTEIQGRRNWGGGQEGCLLLGGARGAEVPFEL